MSSQLYRTTVRVSKKHSVFLYIILEATEGMCFFSTLDDSLGKSYRDVVITATLDYVDQLKHELNILMDIHDLNILNEEFIDDKKT